MAPNHEVGAPTVVLVSPQFPPSPLAAVHRARHLAKHLPSHGWRPIVLRVDERHYAEPADEALGATLATAVEQVRAKALPARVMRPFGIGDIGLRAYPYLSRALDRLVAEQRPKAVFFTGFPFYPFLLAPRLKRRYGIPIVLDFQDPWVSSHGATRPRWSKEGLAHRLAVALEPKVLHAADFVTSVSDVLNADIASRYPWLAPARMAAIPIGGDPDDFVAMRTLTARGDALLEPGVLNLTYVGAYWSRAEPVIRALLRGAAKLRQSDPGLAARLRLNFIGTYSNAAGAAEAQVLPIARAEGLTDMVREAPKRIPFLDALRLLAASDGLFLFGSDEPHYTASKIYPVLMSGRPFLSLFHCASSAHAILAAAGGGIALCFDSLDELNRMELDICDGLRLLAADPESLGTADARSYAPYTAHAVAEKFSDIFHMISR